jgi:hypothetical protein
MVQIRTGGGITGVAGSEAGSTFSHNRSGKYIRAKTVPVNKRSDGHARSRGIFTNLVKAFSSDLSDSQRSSWNTYAAAIARKNKLGETVHLTGQLMFVRSNQARLTAGLPVIYNGPVLLSMPEQDSKISISAIASLQCLWLFFSEDLPWVTEDGSFLSLAIGRLTPPTRNFYNGPWQYADKMLGSSSTPPVSPMACQLSLPMSVGQKLYVKLVIGHCDGRTSNPFYTNCIVETA